MPKIQAQKSALQRFKQSIIILFQNPLPLFSIPFLGVLAVSATEMLIPTDLHISSLESIHDLSMITIPEIASWLVNLIMPFVIGGIVMASFIYALDDIYKGKKADLKESLNFGVRKLGDYAMVLWDIFIYTALIPLIGITILSITLFFLPSFLPEAGSIILATIGVIIIIRLAIHMFIRSIRSSLAMYYAFSKGKNTKKSIPLSVTLIHLKWWRTLGNFLVALILTTVLLLITFLTLDQIFNLFLNAESSFYILSIVEQSASSALGITFSYLLFQRYISENKKQSPCL